MEILKQNIFYTPIWLIKGSTEIIEIIDELKAGCYNFQEKHESEYRSNIGGYQSKVSDYKEFHPAGIRYIDQVLDSLYKEKYVKDEWMISKIAWWFNINKKGDCNMPHIHHNSEVQLVLYLTDGKLTLQDPNLEFCNLKLNIYSKIEVEAKKGDVVIFPSNVQHDVRPHEGEEDRISISFDISLNDHI